MKTYRVPEIARKYVEYDMIQEHAVLPELANARLRLLYACLSQQQSLQTHSELYTLVVSLVQLGMDTHDLIDTRQDQRSETEMRARQLKVLAGDYFSASFYQLLAQAGQIQMIASISSAVSEVNRLKVNLYVRMRQHKLTADEYLNLSVSIKSTLFHVFSEMLEGTLSRVWPEILNGLSLCETLAEELANIGTAEQRYDQGWPYWHYMQAATDEERHQISKHANEHAFIQSLAEKYKVRSQLSSKLQQSADQVLSAVRLLESDELIGELTDIVNSLLPEKTDYTPALNETR
ncbi:heptaprenyl diphosphate synthase component 1 [Paenibacillus sinopodophylli]|uniref:heptaprenyl diphosphate synthase component 1 n=1 Tax=Paenibacillus sinopodophylli TaxID=1837342 RepID=UPI00110CE61B|nr:heptaprenyl diphosphate synthase component 1 [Paenibacillus sinopodophylli]